MIDTAHRKAILTDAISAFKGIGYRTSWFKHDYSYTDLYSSNASRQNIDLGVFGQEPFDYRSACFGLQFAKQGDNTDEVISRVRALGAPQLFYIKPESIERWQIRTNGGILAETTPINQLVNLINVHRDEWSPTQVLRAKSGFVRPGPRNFDFVDLGLLPALEHEAASKIDELVRLTSSMAEEYSFQRGSRLDAQDLFSLIFQMLVGKLLVDRGIPTSPEIDFDDASSVIAAVRNHYPSHDHDVLRILKLPKIVTRNISRVIGNSFSFANLSAETLTYVYENTFVSIDSRKALGIHSTPSYIADYILSQLPIEDMPRQLWNVLDPTCGHGIFLIAAMRRIRSLLPQDWSARQRHSFFVRRMHGVDMEGFSLEVAKLCLMLADFPEANGWDLKLHDIFEGRLLEDLSHNATIVVGNPPFEKMENVSPLRRKPAELLARMLPELSAGSLMGMVLPRSFLDGSDYRKERKQILEGFDLVSITALPDDVFTHAEAESAIVIARKGKQTGSQFYFREVDSSGLNTFRQTHTPNWEELVYQDTLLEKGDSFVVPRFKTIWDRLDSLPKLNAIATIRTGIRFKPNLKAGAVFAKNAANRRFGIETVDKSFMPYLCKGQSYFSLDEELHANSAWQYDWDRPKVIVPASRNSRGPWRYVAAWDESGLCVSRRFNAIWPKEELDFITPTLLVAILNSPIAMAYVYTHSFQIDIPISVYQSIPMPSLDVLHAVSIKIDGLVKDYISAVNKKESTDIYLSTALMRIDAEVLKMYDLPPRMERELLAQFWGANRRVPFRFDGYIPPEFKSAIPLHMYISQGFGEAQLGNIVEHIPVTKNQATLEFLRALEDNAT